MLLEEGIPSVQRRMRGFDVPDFLAAGPRDVLVPEAGLEAARDVLADVRAAQPQAPAEHGGERPLRLLAGILIALAGAAVLVWLLFQATSASAAPILSSGPPPSLPAFKGSAVPARPTDQVTNAPQNPFLAQNPNNNIHNDTWMTDAYQRLGPLGSSLVATSSASTPSLCGSLTFDSRHRIVSVCPSIVAPPQARIIDPHTLATIATYTLPTAPDPPGTKAYQNFTGGGYFFLDQHDRLWVPTKTDHIFVIAESADGQSLVKKRDFDLTGVLDSSTERITSALPDFSGLVWFVSKKNGKVGTVDPSTGKDPRDAPRGGGRELLRGRKERRLHRVGQADVPVRRHQERCAQNRLEGGLSELRNRQAEPGGRGLGDDPHDHERPLRGDHRQRGPDGRGRVSDAPAPPGRTEADGVHGAGIQEGGQRDGELAAHRGSRADRGEQLRLPGPVRAELGRA